MRFFLRRSAPLRSPTTLPPPHFRRVPVETTPSTAAVASRHGPERLLQPSTRRPFTGSDPPETPAKGVGVTDEPFPLTVLCCGRTECRTD